MSDECPITLEPLSDLPYPPFILYSSNDKKSRSATDSAPKTGSQYFFDGVALATYIISQGNFANPLTRNPLSYEDCIRLDEYLDEHIYRNKESQKQFASALFRKEKISMREAYALRNSIKVKVGNRNTESSEEFRRAEVLRNEAAVALRGLFVFGHNSEQHYQIESQPYQAPDLSLGGFDLNYSLDNNQINPWGAHLMEQDGLRIIDDNEAAFNSADTSAWREIQESFPHLPGSNEVLNTRQSQHSTGASEILEVARRTADLTMEEERANIERLDRNRRLYFMQALERKKQRILAKQRSKAAAAKALCNEQKAKDELQIARNEIDRWRDQLWQKWERDNMNNTGEQKLANVTSTNSIITKSPHVDQRIDASTDSAERASAEEDARAKAMAKKKAKRQRAKERAKEKKKEEQQLKQEKERAMDLQKKKDESKVKCGACGEGVLGCGFEKFGIKFCSTKCARSGPATR